VFKYYFKEDASKLTLDNVLISSSDGMWKERKNNFDFLVGEEVF
jgi:hypothetical protein